MSRPRLLAVSHDFSLTGAPIALFHLVLELTRDFEVLVVGPVDGPLREKYIDHNIHALCVRNLSADINVSADLLRSFDAVLCNTIISFLPIHAAHHLQKPSIWYLHEAQAANHFVRQVGQPMVTAFSLATSVVVICEFSRAFFKPVRDKCDLVHNGIDARTCVPMREGNGPLRLLHIGTIDPRKGQDLSCRAMSTLADVNAHLDIVGNVVVSQFHQDLISRYSALPNISFKPGVAMEEARKLIEECDAVLVPSRDEVTPMVILEAQASGKAVIAAKVGGVAEMIEHEKTGLLIDPEQPEQLAQSIRRLASDRTFGQSIGRAAHDFVSQHRTYAQQAEGFKRIILSHLSKR